MKRPLKMVLGGIVLIQLGTALITWAFLGLGPVAFFLGLLMTIAGALLAIASLMDSTPY